MEGYSKEYLERWAINRVVVEKIKRYLEVWPDGSARKPRLTQREFAQRMGVSAATVSNVFSAKQLVTLEFVYKAAASLGYEVTTLLPTISELDQGVDEAGEVGISVGGRHERIPESWKSALDDVIRKSESEG